MQPTIPGTSAMDTESHIAHSGTGYENNGWVDMHSYGQSGGMSDYGSFPFMPPISQGLPSESIRMPPPPAPGHHLPSSSIPSSQSQQQQHGGHGGPGQLPQHQQPQHHPPLPMLYTPSNPGQWPSMLTSPNPGYGTAHSAPPVPRLPRLMREKSNPRKTLTDEDRRNMCRYHELHPYTKQTEIGLMFGVERR